MQKHLYKYFNNMRHNGFLNNVSTTLIDKTDRTLKREKSTGGEPWKSTRPLDLMLKTVSDQSYIAKNTAYGLPFYGIVLYFG